MVYETLKELFNKGQAEINIYDFTTNSPSNIKEKIILKPIFIFEGILSMVEEKIRDLFDIKIFINCD